MWEDGFRGAVLEERFLDGAEIDKAEIVDGPKCY